MELKQQHLPGGLHSAQTTTFNSRITWCSNNNIYQEDYMVLKQQHLPGGLHSAQTTTFSGGIT